MRSVLRLRLAPIAAALVVHVCIAAASAREWSDASGKFRVAAELVKVTETEVHLRTAAGKTLTVPRAKLSEVDRQYLQWKQLEKSVSEADKQAARKLVEQAMVLFDVDPRGNSAQIDRKLREAGKLNPADIRAEFLCGVFNLCVAADPAKAEQNFVTCLARKPGDVAVLSNLALSQVKGNKHGSAIKTFAEAAKAGPGLLAISQNLGRAMKVHNDGRLKMPEQTADQFADLYATLVAEKKFPASRPQLGWLIVNIRQEEFVDFDVDEDADDEDARDEAPDDDEEEEDEQESTNKDLPANVVGGGTGFVVKGDYIVTNSHVVGKKQEVVIRVPGRDAVDGLLNAKVIAVSKSADIAVVHCPNLSLPAVEVVASLPRRGSDVMVLGFPQFSQLGATIKSTRGAVTSLPAAETDNMMLLDAEMNSGNSGGPVANRQGQVVAVATAVFAPIGGTGGKYGAGVPIAAHMEFLKQHIPDLAASPAASDELDWPDVDERISRSTVLVLLVGEREKSDDEEPAPQLVSRGMMLDPTCPACSGRKHRRGRTGQACPSCGGLGLDREVVLHLAEFQSSFLGEDEEEEEEASAGDTASNDAEDSFLTPYDGPPLDDDRSLPDIEHAPSSGGFAAGRLERVAGEEYNEAEGRAINLISLAQPRDLRPAAKWRVAGGKLACVEGNLVPKVVFPINVPEEYDLQIVVTQHALRNGVGLIVPNGHGQSLAWIIGGAGGNDTSLSMIDGYATLAVGDRMFKEEVPYDCVLCVRSERIDGYINGKRVFSYVGNRESLVGNTWHQSPDPDRIAISCDDQATFHMVRFVEIK